VTVVGARCACCRLQTFEFNVTERTEYTLALLTCASIAHDEYVSLQVCA